MFITLFSAMLISMAGSIDIDPVTPNELPLSVGIFRQHIHHPYTTKHGLPDSDVKGIGIDAEGAVIAITEQGNAVFDGVRFQPTALAPPDIVSGIQLDKQQTTRLQELADGPVTINGVAEYGGEFAVAADKGLYIGDGEQWSLALPRQDSVRWAPVDVQAVAYDASGDLWFASQQGVGRRLSGEDWELYTGADGLPFNEFTCIATGPKGVWFGTTNGAIHFQDGAWAFRQGRRWLLDNHVRDVAVDDEGNAWLATSGGISCIVFQPMTLSEKALFYEEEIERYHRRTPFGYVNPAELSAPGEKNGAAAVFTDNDGHNTGLYLGAVSLGYAVMDSPELKTAAENAFQALAFLSEVTEGGTHPAPKGFIARAIRSTSEPDPNPQFDLEYDLRRNKADALWKIIQPRWPVDASGDWYWKNDSSSDELNGHFFGYALYFDHVCETDAERDAVRDVVRRIMDHILEHGYNLVDHDGLPTRWGRFSPDDLNRNEAWSYERGLNSFSILTYLSIAHHITGDPEYREVYLELALEHGYGMNGMTQPKTLYGPGLIGHQPDDNMAFMNYYHLIRYESDPKLLSMYYHAIHMHWQYELRERNPFFTFVYAACCLGKTRVDHWGETDLTPPRDAFDDSIDTLKRYPLDLVDWPMSNAHRIDMKPLVDSLGQPSDKGGRQDGQVLPIDERHEIYWDRCPWVLSYHGEGTRLREGTHYLLAYYMGRAHGFLAD